MAPPFSRASRVWKWVPSAGASVQVKQYDQSGVLDPGDGVLFDVNLGILIDTPLNQDTTHSGDNGGSSFTRVGGIWTYRLSLGFPAALIGTEQFQVQPANLAFVQQLLGSSGYVWMQFFVGDPEYWESLGVATPVRSFIGRRSLLSEAEQRFEVGTKKVIGLNIAGQGSSLLRAMLDDVQVYP